MSSGSLGSNSSSSGSLSFNSASSTSSSQSQPDGHGIRLKKYVQTKYVINNVDGFRMKIDAYDANNMSNAIFRYIRGPFSASTGTYSDEFDGVCSPSDLEEFPEGSPTPGANPAWFRKGSVDLVFRSQTTANETWDKIVSDVKILVNTLDIMDVIQPETTVSIGSPAI
jgi:hypothetical protein